MVQRPGTVRERKRSASAAQAQHKGGVGGAWVACVAFLQVAPRLPLPVPRTLLKVLLVVAMVTLPNSTIPCHTDNGNAGDRSLASGA